VSIVCFIYPPESARIASGEWHLVVVIKTYPGPSTHLALHPKSPRPPSLTENMGSIAFNEEPIEIAVVGGGIVGLILTAGLVHRNIKVKLYEQARGFRKIGTGIAFTANVTKCMEIINPAIVAALRSGGSVPTSADKNDPNDYLRWTDGFNERDEAQSLLYKIDAGYRGFEGCRRDQFLEALVKIIPKGTIELRKRLEGVQRSEKLTLHFNDDTRAEADASNLPC